jgi:hypothetical protein
MGCNGTQILQRIAAVAATLAVIAGRAGAQGCAMCYQNAAAAGAGAQAGLRHGILILLIPAVGVFGGILALIHRRRNSS